MQTITISPFLTRALSLYIPIILSFLIWAWCKPIKQDVHRELGAILLASCYALVSLPLLNWLAITLGWWHFNVESGVLWQMPIDLFVGWVILWATIPAQLEKYGSIPLICLGLLLLDIIFMPLLSPVLVLGEQWLWGELLGVIIILFPAIYLARWIRLDRHLYARMTIIGMVYIALTFLLLPAIILAQTGGGFVLTIQNLLAKPLWQLSLRIQLTLLLPAIIGLSAVQEFVVRGQGTPIPFDPPKRLVTSGLYAYIANPMQLGTALGLLGWGIMLGSGWVAAAGLMTVAYGLGIAAFSEQDEMPIRFGEQWVAYRGFVHNWWPRWRPINPHLTSSGSGEERRIARLYVAASCDPCSALGQWVSTQQPLGLEILPAETYSGESLTRLTYESGDGQYRATGVAALARAVEHINLGWALLDALMRLPLLNPFLQLVIDSLGGGPKQHIETIETHDKQVLPQPFYQVDVGVPQPVSPQPNSTDALNPHPSHAI
ncbi:MAG: methyltransferase [Chloroflexota bacterium]